MHWILSKIKTSADIDQAIADAILEGIINKTTMGDLKTKLLSIVTHPKLAGGFQIGTVNKMEAELITQNGELLRPDRVIFDSDSTLLIDYKTGKENNSVYFKQLNKYEAALISMGYKNIRKVLVYIDDLTVVEVK
jgi:hypothetical protein